MIAPFVVFSGHTLQIAHQKLLLSMHQRDNKSFNTTHRFQFLLSNVFLPRNEKLNGILMGRAPGVCSYRTMASFTSGNIGLNDTGGAFQMTQSDGSFLCVC